MTKFPATTPEAIDALPDGVTFESAHGISLRKSCGEWRVGNQPGQVVTVGQIIDGGGITARLTDPAPLEALLREATCEGCYCHRCSTRHERCDCLLCKPVPCDWCDRREAALGGQSDG